MGKIEDDALSLISNGLGLALGSAFAVAKKARRVFGNEAQDRMVNEEVGELLVSIARRGRGRGSQEQVDEEVADVLLVTLGMLNENSLSVLEQKTERLRGLIDAAPSVDADMAAEVTLAEALRRRGFYSRTGKGGCVIYSFATGEPVERDEQGQERTFSPQDAWEWLKRQEVK